MVQLPDWLQSLAKWMVLLSVAFLAQFLIFGDRADPTGKDPWMFALLFLFVVSSVCGRIVATLGKRLRLPPLLGNLLAGLLLRNLPWFDMYGGAAVTNKHSSSIIFDVSLSLILCKAGMSMNFAEVLKLKWVVMRLAALPFIAEASTVAGLSCWILNFPVHWGFMLGSLWAGVAPAIVIPPMLSFTAEGYGVGTGIVPASIASSVGDDALAIVTFGVFKRFLQFYQGTYDPWPAGYAKVPFELVAGGLVGALFAVVLVVSTRPTSDGETPSLDTTRLVMLIGGSLVSNFGIKALGYPGCAAVATLALALLSGAGWGTAAAKRVAGPLGQVWNFAIEPLLFGLMGCQVKFQDLTLMLVAQGTGMLACGLIARFLAGYLCMAGRGLTWKEKLFTALSQWPKATMQAALGTAALDAATGPREEEMGRQILQLCVLIILLTAPVGATLIAFTGPRMLRKEPDMSLGASWKNTNTEKLSVDTNTDLYDFENQDDVPASSKLRHEANLKSLTEQYDAASFP